MKQAIYVLIALVLIRLFIYNSAKPHIENNQELTFITTVTDIPKETSSYNRMTANYGNVVTSEKIIVTYSPKTKLTYGDTIQISGKIEKRVLKNKDVILTMYFPQIEAVKKSNNFLLALADRIRQYVENVFYENLPKDQAGLMVGILLGVNANFTKQFFTNLQTAGVLHVIAASGMNVSMIAGLCFSIFGSFLRRQLAIVLSIAAVGFYVILAGMQPSIVRAGIMGTLAFSAQLLGRQYSGLYGLILAASSMILYDPSLATDVGFQLSVTATAGIMYIKPLLPSAKALEDLTTTLAAQIATLPIMLASFGTYGLLSVPVNFLVLWTIPILMALGALGVLASLINDHLGSILIYCCKPFLWWFITIINIAGNSKWTLTINYFPFALSLGYYAMLIACIIYRNKTNSEEKLNLNTNSPAVPANEQAAQ